jgi:hypothetical protein
VRAERLDAIVTSLRAGGPGMRGELWPLRCWSWRSIHWRVKRESSGRKVVGMVETHKEIKGLAQQPRVPPHSLEHPCGEFGYSHEGDGKYGIDCAGRVSLPSLDD